MFFRNFCDRLSFNNKFTTCKAMNEHSQVIEEYLLLLYKLDRSGEKAKAVTLADRLETSAPTVHATIARMQRDGLVDVKKSKELNR